MMVRVYRPKDEEDRKKVLNYTTGLNQTGKKPMAVTVYAPEEDVKKWQDKADECGWPLQLYIISVMNGYCRYLEDYSHRIPSSVHGPFPQLDLQSEAKKVMTLKELSLSHDIMEL